MKQRKKKLVAINKRGRRIGSTHHRAHHSDETIARIRALKAEGLSYQRISATLKEEGSVVPVRTVRDVIYGNTRAQQPAEWRKPGERRDTPRPPAYDFPSFQWMPFKGDPAQQWEENNASADKAEDGQ